MAQNTQSGSRPAGSCYLPGNVVFSCGVDVQNTPGINANPSDMMQGFGRKEHNPMYKTSASDYGSGLPNYHTMPTEFHYKSQKFSEHLLVCDPNPRNESFNTAVTPSKV